MTELESKIARLPAWARNHIRHLETRSEPLVEESSRARKGAELLRDRNNRLVELCDGLIELIRKAATGGHINAQIVADVLDSYGFSRPS